MLYENKLLPFLTEGLDQKEKIEENITLFQQAINRIVDSAKIWLDKYAMYTVLVILLSIIVYLIGRKLIKWTVKLTRHGLERSTMDEGATGFICAMVKTVSYIVLAMIIANILGIDTTSIVAILGSAGLAVGLALKGTLANFAGGLLILFTKPFVVGDFIIAEGNEGTVTKIDIFYTHILTVDNQSIVLPNGDLSNMQLTNSTNEEKRRLDIMIPVSYDADIDHVRAVLQGICKSNELVLQTEPIDVFLYEFGDSAINISLRVWTETDSYWPLKWRLQEEIKKALDQAGISIPFNQLDVHIIKE
ncbi:MAG: mechanosensitive ion channel family protein [bacterium]|nr:mechanosensitive ion channel family protein [bacterium]